MLRLCKNKTMKQKKMKQTHFLGSSCKCFCSIKATQHFLNLFLCVVKTKIYLQKLKGLNKVNNDGAAWIFWSIYILLLVPEGLRLYSPLAGFSLFVLLWSGKRRPRCKTAALHLASSQGVWHKTNGSW